MRNNTDIYERDIKPLLVELVAACNLRGFGLTGVISGERGWGVPFFSDLTTQSAEDLRQLTAVVVTPRLLAIEKGKED